MHGWGFAGGAFGAGGYGMPTRRFEEQYHCYSVAYADKAHLEVSLVSSLEPFSQLLISVVHMSSDDCSVPFHRKVTKFCYHRLHSIHWLGFK